MKCPKCAADNPEGVNFCGECGASLSANQTCARCGHMNPPGKKLCHECGHSLTESVNPPSAAVSPPPSPVPTSFANGRYQVKKFLGEGGKKKVHLAHHTVLDRDVAFALIKTEKLDETARTGIKREAQAMGRLGDHPNIVTVFDFGDHDDQPHRVPPFRHKEAVKA